jgi:NACalpha-BTF3-like transcription factor
MSILDSFFEEGPGVREISIDLVINVAGVTREEAIIGLIHTCGDIMEAIILLQSDNQPPRKKIRTY